MYTCNSIGTHYAFHTKGLVAVDRIHHRAGSFLERVEGN